MVEFELDPHAGDHPDLLIQHGLRQPERRNVGPHEATGLPVLLEDRHLISQRQQIVRDRQ